ncbi:MAG: aspartate aminotransferase family protein [Haloferacaceae archaeon]
MAKQDPTVERATSSAIPHWYGPDDDPLTITEGEGAWVYDDAGNAHLDFLSQLYCVNAGHSNEAIVEAIEEQLGRIPYVASSKANDVRTALAERLTEVAPGDLSDVYFAISGSEANESAALIAREYTGSGTILTRYQSYHGSTLASSGFTGDPSTRNTTSRHAGATGAAKFLPPLVHDSPFDGDTPEEIGRQAAEHVEYVIRNQGPDSVAAVLTEPIAGSSGAYPAPPGYFPHLRDVCDDHDVLLISDEVICGFGRCGDWFGIDTEGVVPDMLTFAKGVTSSYVPLAGVVAKPEIGRHIREEGIDVGQTFAGHPLACAAGLAAIDEYEDGLIDNVRELEPVFAGLLEDLESRHDVVATVRGRGFHWAVVFEDPETGEPFFDPWTEDEGDNPVETVVSECQDRGLIVGQGRPAVQVLLCPPLVVDEEEIETAVERLDAAIEATFY